MSEAEGGDEWILSRPTVEDPKRTVLSSSGSVTLDLFSNVASSARYVLTMLGCCIM